MPTDTTNTVDMPPRYVRAEQLLATLFEPASKPSLRWLRDQQAKGKIPFIKIGRLVFFDPVAVKAALDARAARMVR